MPGTTLYLTVGGTRQREDVLSGGSYLSSNDMRAHFGLGNADKVDGVEIRWAGGPVEKLQLPAVDRIYTVEEGKGITGSLCTLCAKGKK
jgi:enediyne biosynthesis protein E4